MLSEWSFRDELLKATHHWPMLALFCLLGSLFGWAVSMVWPTPHRATRELYVGLNVYNSTERTKITEYAGVEIVNANDFKNWQMASLNSLILKDDVIDETLRRLKQADPYWNSFNRNELADSLDVYWRNAGKWRLVAENQDPNRAAQAVIAWEDVVVDRVHAAVLAAQQAMVLELQMVALAEQRASIITQIESHQRLVEEFNKTKKLIESRPKDQVVTSKEHWQIWQLSHAAGAYIQNPGLFEQFPREPTAAVFYDQWIVQIIPFIQENRSSLQQQKQSLDASMQEIAAQFSEASQKSLGLSATLDVDKISETRIQSTVVRPIGPLMLVGSMLGSIVWIIYWLSTISSRGRA